MNLMSLAPALNHEKKEAWGKTQCLCHVYSPEGRYVHEGLFIMFPSIVPVLGGQNRKHQELPEPPVCPYVRSRLLL